MALSKIEADSLDIGQVGGRRNLIINGSMQVAQRGTQSVGGSAGVHYGGPDRMRVYQATSTVQYTLSQDSNSPNGFANSFKLDVTTADTSIEANNRVDIIYRFEGQELQGIAKGTSDAKELTLSFWVRSPKTGTHTVEFFDNDNDRQISKTYTISTADTWEHKVISIPADTTGAYTNDNTLALQVSWYMMAGSNYTSGTLNSSSWASFTNANRVSSDQVNVFDSTSNAFYLTGVQLEVGDTATPFEHRSYGEELALCQRYFQRYAQGSSSSRHFIANVMFSDSTDSAFTINLPTSMRAVPTLTFASLQVLRGGVGYYSGTNTSLNGSTPPDGVPINVLRFAQTTGSSGASQGDCGQIACTNSTSSRFDLDAEL